MRVRAYHWIMFVLGFCNLYPAVKDLLVFMRM
jgi:hypothetical protein